MLCETVQSLLDDRLDGTLQDKDETALVTHLSQCDHCSQIWQQTVEVNQLVQQYSVPAVKNGFYQQAFKKARDHHANQNHSGFVAGFSSAMAACLLLVIVFVFSQNQNTNLQAVLLTLNEARTVDLVFNLPEDFMNVTFSMHLPDNVELTGYPGQKKLTWQTNIYKGQNVLSLPFIATGKPKGMLTATLIYGEQEKVFRIPLILDIRVGA